MNERSRFLSVLRALSVSDCHILVAVSGGADSVALLRLLVSARSELSLTLSAAHMEHGIRGEASLADCAFVESLCRRLDVPLTVCHADVPAAARASHEGLETCARRLRRDFLQQTRLSLGADFLALAHHGDDQAETVLMHLLRGSGLSGAAAMQPLCGPLLRPLLGFSRAEIEAYLAEIGQDFRTDATNAVYDNPRNALRGQVFPLLTAIYPGAIPALNRFAAIAADEDACLRAAAERLWAEQTKHYAGIVALSSVSTIDPCLLRRLIRRALPDSDFEDVERARLASGHVQLSGGAEAWRLGDVLYLAAPLAAPAPVAVPPKGRCVLPGVCALTVAPCAPVPVRGNPFEQVVPAPALAGCVLRTRRDGDFIRPFGLHGQKKSLSDYLTDRKFPYPLRSRLPLLARDNEILWAAGVGLSEALRTREGDDARLIRVEINA